MNDNIYEFISNEELIKSNKAAEEFLNKINKLNYGINMNRKLYFTFIEIHNLIWNKKETKDIYCDFFHILSFDEKIEKIINDDNNIINNIFWNELLSYDDFGDKQSVNEILKKIRKKYGQKNSFIRLIEYKVSKFFPDYKDLKLKKYLLSFYQGHILYEVEFKARITNELIYDFYKKSCRAGDFVKNIKELLKYHNIEYINFNNRNLTKTENEIRNYYIDLTLIDFNEYYFKNEFIENIKNFDLCMTYLDNCHNYNEDYYEFFNCIFQIIKNEEDSFYNYKFISYKNSGDDYDGQEEVLIKNNVKNIRIESNNNDIKCFNNFNLFEKIDEIDNEPKLISYIKEKK